MRSPLRSVGAFASPALRPPTVAQDQTAHNGEPSPKLSWRSTPSNDTNSARQQLGADTSTSTRTNEQQFARERPVGSRRVRQEDCSTALRTEPRVSWERQVPSFGGHPPERTSVIRQSGVLNGVGDQVDAGTVDAVTLIATELHLGLSIRRAELP
jgi:hypothetical protein